jgi:hypothetical protein
LEKVNIQTDYIVRVFGGFMAAAVPHNLTASFRNAGISLLWDNHRAIRWIITQEMAHYLLGAPFSGALPIPKKEEYDEDLDIREYVGQVEPRLIEGE